MEGSEYGSPDAAVSLVVPAGTELRLALETELGTAQSETGDRFEATVVQPVLRDDHTAIPAGATVSGLVTAVQQASEDKPAVLKIDFDQIETYGEPVRLRASLTRAEVEHGPDASAAEDRARVGVGTPAGAVVGRILHGNTTSTLVEPAVGAATGTAIVLSDASGEAVLREGAELRILLTDALRIDAGQATVTISNKHVPSR
jgi:hypothetical protein